MQDHAKHVELENRIEYKKLFFLYFFLSFGLLLYAQPDLSNFACIVASFGGYALFWKSLSFLPKSKTRFFVSTFWFSSILFAHLSWFTADQYVGWPIFIFLILLVSIIGMLFGLLCLLIPKPQKITFSTCLMIAAIWTLFEWLRLFILSGFSWDPIGIVLTANIYSLQFASILGIFGLTFWTLFTNILVYKSFCKSTRISQVLFCGIIVLTPYVYGAFKLTYHKTSFEKHDILSALLVQTALYPEEKTAYRGSETKMVPLLDQWKKIFSLLKQHQNKKVDLILFSEHTVPYGTFLPIYSQKEASDLLKGTFSQNPYTNHEKLVGNYYFAQNLSTIFNADLVIGFEDGEWVQEKFKVYNAAFFFHPDYCRPERYEKRVLVPMGEYIPFSFCKKFLSRYGISDSFSPGTEAKVFLGKKVPIGISICYEETYGHLMRQNRRKGAKLLVNLTNDVWYPHSRLPIVHFYHGRIRAVEAGMPLLRASNTGVTCAVDSFGRIIDMLPFETKQNESPRDALHVNVSTYCYPTIYSRFGDVPIVLVSIFCLLLPGFPKFLFRKSSSKEIGIEQN